MTKYIVHERDSDECYVCRTENDLERCLNDIALRREEHLNFLLTRDELNVYRIDKDITLDLDIVTPTIHYQVKVPE